VRVQVLASRRGGLIYGPFVHDTRGTGRFPPAVRLRASVLGLQLGELTIANAERFGHVLELEVGWAWLLLPVARCLLREAERLGPEALWKHLAWRLPAADAGALAFASSLGFQPVSTTGDEVELQRPIGDVPR
jgi:hypothetical protein